MIKKSIYPFSRLIDHDHSWAFINIDLLQIEPSSTFSSYQRNKFNIFFLFTQEMSPPKVRRKNITILNEPREFFWNRKKWTWNFWYLGHVDRRRSQIVKKGILGLIKLFIKCSVRADWCWFVDPCWQLKFGLMTHKLWLLSARILWGFVPGPTGEHC